MDRRNARLRKEYLYRKSLEAEEVAFAEKKRKLQQAIEEGKPIPTELRKESAELKKGLETDDPSVRELKTHVDDEYQKVGVYDPKVLITSSRDASTRLLQFIKELRQLFPNSQRMNRGTTGVGEIAAMCREGDFTDLVIVHEHRGEPDGLIISHFPYGPTAYFGMTGCVLRHDLSVDPGSVSEAYPHLIFHNFTTKLGQRTQTILQSLFPVPKEDTKRVVTFVNRDDTISFRHHIYRRVSPAERAAKNKAGLTSAEANGGPQSGEDKSGKKDIELAEVGPRFELKLYQIRLGTIEMNEAENEWVLRPYMNTAKKRKAI